MSREVYEYDQNNSGGIFAFDSYFYFVLADNPKHSDYLIEQYTDVKLYCSYCPCCGPFFHSQTGYDKTIDHVDSMYKPSDWGLNNYFTFVDSTGIRKQFKYEEYEEAVKFMETFLNER